MLAALAAREFDVHASARHANVARSGTRVTWHSCDLLSAEEARRLVISIKPDIVVHCAWVTEHGAYWTSAQNLDWVMSTLTLIAASQSAGASRFVGVGTCAEYAWGNAEPLQETRSTLQPSTLYGVAKDATRRLCEAFAQQSGMSFAWTRVFFLYGASEQPNRFISSLARALVRGEPASMSSGIAVRDFMDARDAGGAIAAVADSPICGAINIGTGVGTTLRSAGETLARLAGKPELLRLNALPDRPSDPAVLVANVQRLTQEIEFRPSISLERGLQDALDYWRKEAGL
ncbi:MAG: NAD(P)-dependent oxidoreductase [Alphaproteobacteria bacterium]|nr:NAD(P)-dependent oxidoreductase [Alphaproteobacteria bacterium]